MPTTSKPTKASDEGAAVLDAMAAVGTHIQNTYSTKEYVDSEVTKATSSIQQEIITLRGQMANRDDIHRIENSINTIQLSIASSLATKVDVMTKTESELRLKPLEASIADLRINIAAMHTVSDNRLWDMFKTVIPWVIMGIGAAVAASGHIVVH